MYMVCDAVGLHDVFQHEALIATPLRFEKCTMEILTKYESSIPQNPKN